MAERDGLSNTEQWLLLGVPIGLLFGYLFYARRAKAQRQKVVQSKQLGPNQPGVQGLVPYDAAQLARWNAPGNPPFI